MIEDNFKAAVQIAPIYGKKFGVFVGNGTLALELALRYAGIKKNDIVVTSDLVCHSVVTGILRADAQPLLIGANESLLLDIEKLSECVKKVKISAVVCVHYLGLPINVKIIKQIVGNNVVVIEDAAQAWRLRCSNNSIGSYSDIVVTSFGNTKPVSLGGGGALFCNSKDIYSWVDCDFRNAIKSEYVPLPYGLHSRVFKDISNAIEIADKKLEERQRVAELLTILLKKNKNMQTWKENLGDEASYHRIPIFFLVEGNLKQFQRDAKKEQIKFQIPHNTKLHDFACFKKRVSIYSTSGRKPHYLLLYPTKYNLEKMQTIALR